MRFIRFTYLGHAYGIYGDAISGYYNEFASDTRQCLPAGQLTFGPEATAAIKTWCANLGFAGMPLEEYLDKVLGPPQ